MRSSPVLMARQPQLQAPAASPGDSPGNSDSSDEVGSEARARAPASSVGDVIAVGVLAAAAPAAPDVSGSGQKRKRQSASNHMTNQRRRCFEAGQKEGGDPEACCRKGARPGGSRLVYIPCEKHE